MAVLRSNHATDRHSMKRAWYRAAGIVGILAIVFAQVVTAAYACSSSPPSPKDEHGAAARPCDSVEDLPALCIKHCQEEPQNAQDPLPGAISFPVVLLYRSRTVAEPARRSQPVEAPKLLRSPPLPLAIRNCCFRI